MFSIVFLLIKFECQLKIVDGKTYKGIWHCLPGRMPSSTIKLGKIGDEEEVGNSGRKYKFVMNFLKWPKNGNTD